MVLKPDCPSKIYRKYSSPKISQIHCLESGNLDVLKAEGPVIQPCGLHSEKTLSSLRTSWEWNALWCRLPVTLLFLAPLLFPSPKQQQRSKGHHLGITLPSDLFLFDNVLLKHVHFTPSNHIYQVFQPSSC